MGNWEKVENIENTKQAKEKANKAKTHKIIIGTSIGALALFIILTGNSKHYFDKQNSNVKPAVYVPENTINITSTSTTVDYAYPQINYDGAKIFYDSIIKIKQDNPESFNTCFTSYNDIKDYVDFICYFDSTFLDKNKPDSISDLNDFLAITDSYYKDCAKYKIKPELNTLFNNSTYMENKIKTVEELANNLHNSKGNDYSEANAYYSELINDLGITDDISTENLTNCPGCEVLISICENYNHVGNAYDARCNGQILKTDGSDTLNIKNRKAYVCPDSAFKSITGDFKDKIDMQINNNYLKLKRTR